MLLTRPLALTRDKDVLFIFVKCNRSMKLDRWYSHG